MAVAGLSRTDVLALTTFLKDPSHAGGRHNNMYRRTQRKAFRQYQIIRTNEDGDLEGFISRSNGEDFEYSVDPHGNVTLITFPQQNMSVADAEKILQKEIPLMLTKMNREKYQATLPKSEIALNGKRGSFYLIRKFSNSRNRTMLKAVKQNEFSDAFSLCCVRWNFNAWEGSK